jgi:formylmethanofuran dehydrogenase subunit E
MTSKPNIALCGRSLSEYLKMVESFHGYAAPGMVLGGFMVELAVRRLPQGTLFEALCETPKCLPDAIQLLTPCTVGNGRLKIVNLGRFALTLFDKRDGVGERVFVDPVRVAAWPVIESWFFKRVLKADQDGKLLLEQIVEAGGGVCNTQRARVSPGFLGASKRKGFSVCPGCYESYPSDDGEICRGCGGEAPYVKVE